jgi:hypothetical protein
LSLFPDLASDSDELTNPVGVELAHLVLHIVVGQAQVELFVSLAKLITHLNTNTFKNTYLQLSFKKN